MCYDCRKMYKPFGRWQRYCGKCLKKKEYIGGWHNKKKYGNSN